MTKGKTESLVDKIICDYFNKGARHELDSKEFFDDLYRIKFQAAAEFSTLKEFSDDKTNNEKQKVKIPEQGRCC